MNREEKLKSYKQILAQADIPLKGRNNPYTSHNGHMFSFLGQQDIVAIRLAKPEQEAFLARYNTTFPVRQYNANMRDYVELPDELLKDTKAAVKYIKMAKKFVDGLPPK